MALKLLSWQAAIISMLTHFTR